MIREAPYPAETRAKGWRFELDHERICETSATWQLAAPAVRPWLLMLWMTAWRQTPCGSLDHDDALIAARIGMPAKDFAKHRAILLRGWWLAEDGRLYHDTITERVLHMLSKRANDAQRAANRRERNASHAEVTRDADVTHAEVPPEFDTKHQAPKKTIEAKASHPGKPGDAMFDAFWQAYPRKVGKDAARKAFDKRKPDAALLALMLAAVAKQARSDAWLKDGGDYIPHPATWLNQGRWMDEDTELSVVNGSVRAVAETQRHFAEQDARLAEAKADPEAAARARRAAMSAIKGIAA